MAALKLGFKKEHEVLQCMYKLRSGSYSSDRCPGVLLLRAWKAKQLNERLTADMSCCRSCRFPLSTLVLVGEKLHYEMTKQYVNSGKTDYFFLKCIFWFYRPKDICSVTVWIVLPQTSLNQICFLYLSVISFGRHTHQSSHTSWRSDHIQHGIFFS